MLFSLKTIYLCYRSLMRRWGMKEPDFECFDNLDWRITYGVTAGEYLAYKRWKKSQLIENANSEIT